MGRRGIWAGPKVKKDVTRPTGPHDPTPIILKGLWHELSPVQQRRLTKMGFDEFSWNNNVREQVKADEFEMWVGGSDHPRVYPMMTGDRARKVSPPVANFDVGFNP